MCALTPHRMCLDNHSCLHQSSVVTHGHSFPCPSDPIRGPTFQQRYDERCTTAGSPGWWCHGPRCSEGYSACTEPEASPGRCVPTAPCSRQEEYLAWGPAGGGGRDLRPRPSDAPGTFCFSVPTTQSHPTGADVLEGHSRSPGEFALRWPLGP